MSAAARKPLGELSNDTGVTGASEKYKKLSQREHVLVRPDTYVGSVEKITDTMVVFDEGKGFVNREVSYVPGLFKIFDEILVNASDNKQRDPSMSVIKVTIDKDAGTISVLNDGCGIPVELHSKEKVYIPELIFGNLLTGSNYDDKQRKTTGGRNGYGAKLANIFSTSFIVETADSKSGMLYKQKFTDNMTKGHGKQKIKEGNTEDWTKITFTPDLEKFGMESLDDDILALMTRRVYDIAGVTRGVKVSLNGKNIPIRSFRSYVDMVLKNREGDFPVLHEVVNDRWEVCMTVSTQGFQQVSFVNSIATTKGGTHVNYITDQMVKSLAPVITKKNKAATVKNHQIKAHLWVFVNCLVENPTFDSQTKENHTLAASKFGSKAVLGEKFLKGVAKSGIIDNILVWAKVKGQELLSKKSGGAKRTRLTGIPKLDDANEAGGRNSKKCTLILTEGDSAKTLALSGLSVIGRDYYGVFPLKGKPLNVREASNSQVMDNQEIKSIVEIMGLQYTKKYDEDSISRLRYGSIMIMADQDQDGSHIKGLLINFIHYFWPELLRIPGFLVEFITPIVKATRKNNEKVFFTLPEYLQWAEETQPGPAWKIKYYKGLGTSTPQEAKAYFAKMDEHQLSFAYIGEEDDKAIEMAFSKKQVEDRKNWLRAFKPGTYLDHSVEEIPYSTFIHKELILFSMADNVRSIPSMVDGFKPGQRKVLFSCFKRKLTNEIKVAQLSGYVAEHSAYHHGENSLAGTIINMAQNYVGSNNITLLVPEGQFGTRIQGGKDAASPRYTFTRLSKITRAIFHNHDDPLLTNLEDDGQIIEPKWYLPVIPMVLVNGADGIGTGWSSRVPNFDPVAICNYLRAMLRGEEPEELTPYFRGFTGRIERDAKKATRFNIYGTITKIDDTTLDITELPIREWTQDYKNFLEGLLTGEEGPGAFQSKSKKTEAKEPSIKDYKEYHTDTTVNFRVVLSEEQMAAAEAVGLEKKFKLESSVSLTNMILFDSAGRIKKYDTVHEIVKEFYDLRLEYYQKRKDDLADKLTELWSRLDNQVKFILAIVNGELDIRNKPKATIIETLRSEGYKPFPKKAADEDMENDPDYDPTSAAGAYDYLLGMSLWTLTMEKVEKLKSERDEKEAELTELLEKTPEDLWIADLDNLEAHLADVEEEDSAIHKNSLKLAANIKKGGGKKPVAKKKKKKIQYDSEGEILDDDDSADDWAPKVAKAKKAAPKKQASKPAASKSAPKNVRLRSPTPAVADAATASPAPKQAKKAQSAVSKFVMSDTSEDESELTGLAARLAIKSKESKKPSAKKSLASDDDDMQDSQPKKPVSKRTAAKKAPKIVDDVFDDSEMSLEEEDSDGDFVPEAKKPAAKKAAAKKAAAPKKAALKKAPARKASKIVDDDSDDFGMSLEEADSGDDFIPEPKKPAAKKVAPKKAASKKAAPKKAPAKKASKIVDDDSDDFEMSLEAADSDDDFNPEPKKPAAKKVAPKKAAPKKAAPKKAPAKKAPAKKPAKNADSEDDFEPEAPKAKKTVKKPAAKASASFTDDSDFDDDGMSIEPSGPAATRPSRRAAAAKVTYADSDEEVDLLDESMSEEEAGSDSDFSP